MDCNCVSIGSIIEFSAGGGWGRANYEEGFEKVAIIRSADFPKLYAGNYDGLPIRYEKAAKVEKVSLNPGDIVLENSGGTDTRPTGRTLRVTQELLEAYSGLRVIPASFCRILRLSDSVDPSYAYYWLQDMYNHGRTWGYQNRSTGIANFQYQIFSREEIIRLPSQKAQASIARVLGAIDNLMISLNRTNGYLSAA